MIRRLVPALANSIACGSRARVPLFASIASVVVCLVQGLRAPFPSLGDARRVENPCCVGKALQPGDFDRSRKDG